MPHTNMYHDSIIVQDACNPAGIAASMVQHMQDILNNGGGTEDIKNNPAIQLFTHKLSSLCFGECLCDKCCKWYEHSYKQVMDRLKSS